MSDEEVLSGGTLTAVVRVGDTVRRATNFWSPSVHALLRHLEEKGFSGAPRFLGIDTRGRETLTFLHGDVTIDGPPSGMYTEASVSGAATLLRAFHDATIDFVRGESADWQFQVGAPTTGPVICHNDVGPYNTIYRAGGPVAFFDWDFAAPGPREWDVAYALWRFVPLYDDATCARLGWPIVPRGPRIARFLEAYGLDRREDLFDMVLRRMEVTSTTIHSRADAGSLEYIQLRREGRLSEIGENIRYVEQSHREWEAFLR
jgi:Phosphotransferase enzyme family